MYEFDRMPPPRPQSRSVGRLVLLIISLVLVLLFGGLIVVSNAVNADDSCAGQVEFGV